MSLILDMRAWKQNLEIEVKSSYRIGKTQGLNYDRVQTYDRNTFLNFNM